MATTDITTIGIIGAGRIGSQIARLAVQHGYRAVISNSRGPETLADLVSEIGGEVRAATPAEAAAAGDLVLVAIPTKQIGTLPVAQLAGRIVVDADNYYPPRDGAIAELQDGSLSSSGLLQRLLPESRVVKAFNQIAAADLTGDASPAGTPNRRALAVFGDDPAARAVVAALIDEFGFDTVDGGPLDESRRVEPGSPAYATRDDADALRTHLAEATAAR